MAAAPATPLPAPGPLVRLRALEPDDLEFLYALENDAAVWAVSDTLAPVSRYALREYLAHATADFHEARQLRLVVEPGAGGPAVGVVDLFGFEPLHQRAGVGIIILATARRRGYARHTLALLVAHARDVLRLHQLYCTVAAANRASLRLFQAAGFRRVGTRRAWLRGPAPGQWSDAVEFQLVLGSTG
ncbi:GNAT family N-acetyltransferase [Hymenobacter sp. PAMC 26628]|uniref:GNAT family N-acetyltransferase n=1 Tax=Hymenobacter sp. PAMC 26628 TaxID=1484118 RepID=UPI000A4535C2|nr:GNAT family N-acetyltransferase [Hymenobacter sp. PAMC 26628]